VVAKAKLQPDAPGRKRRIEDTGVSASNRPQKKQKLTQGRHLPSRRIASSIFNFEEAEELERPPRRDFAMFSVRSTVNPNCGAAAIHRAITRQTAPAQPQQQIEQRKKNTLKQVIVVDDSSSADEAPAKKSTPATKLEKPKNERTQVLPRSTAGSKNSRPSSKIAGRKPMRGRLPSASQAASTKKYLSKPKGKAKDVLFEPHSEYFKRLGPDLLSIFPREVRDSIYHHLLVSNEPIHVRQLWTQIYPRRRPGLYTAIMRTSKKMLRETLPILYGRNNFLYLVREPTKVPSSPPKDAIVVRSPHSPNWDVDVLTVDGKDHAEEEFVDPPARGVRQKKIAEDQLRVKKMGHFFRKITIVAEENRSEREYRETMARAIETFCNLNKVASLHTITLELTPMLNSRCAPPSFISWFDRHSNVVMALKKLPTQFIKVVVNNARQKDEPIQPLLIDMRYKAWARRSMRGENDLWEDDELMLESRRRKALAARRALNFLATNIKAHWELDVPARDDDIQWEFWYGAGDDIDDDSDMDLA
jgi:hypothetical protein